MTEKTTRTRKAAAAPKARTAPKSIAASASMSSRVAAKDTAKAAIEAAAAAVAPRAPKAPEAAIAVSPAALSASRAPQAEAPARAPVAAFLQAGSDPARDAFVTAKATAETLRQAVAESAAASSRGVIEVNDKLIDAMRAQSDAAFDLWRSALTATSVSEAIRIQTGGARQVYETAATQWKDIAETTGRWLAASVKPMQSVFTVTGR